MKMDFKWIDLHKVVLDHRNQSQTATFDNIGDSILQYIENKYCGMCYKHKYCHDECVKCDEFNELLESIGFEV